MNEIVLGALLVSFYIAGWAIIGLHEESTLWRNSYDSLLMKYGKMEAELEHLKSLKYINLITENENKLE